VTSAVPGFRDPSLTFAERADDLLGRLTDDEKIAMLHQRSPAVPRLGVAEFCTGTEGVHGAAWRDHRGTGLPLPATVFPQPVGLAASWDPDLALAVGRATGREVRALHERRPLIGLNVWAPVVNLLRDPRWGRNEEGYSEDPLLTAKMATAFCRGLAGDAAARDPAARDPAGGEDGADESATAGEGGAGGGYLLTAPTLKHFLGYNNEDHREQTSSALRPRVLHEYDLPPFREPIAAGVATGVMPSYNLVNDRPAHVSPLLLLVRTWTDVELLTCSDAWAPSKLVDDQHYFDDHAQGHAAALKAGLDSFTDHESDGQFTAAVVTEALRRGLVTIAEVDRAVRRKLLIRLRLGEFDPDGGPYATAGVMDTPEHRELARTAARRSMVLLENDGLLPLPERTPHIAVVGPLADTIYEDWYSPALPYQVTIADGLARAATTITVHEAADRVRTDLGEFDVTDWGDGVVTLRRDGKFLTVTDDRQLAVQAERPDGWIVRETFRRTPLPGGNAVLTSTATGLSVRLRWDVLSDGVSAAAARAADADVAVVVVGNHPLIGARESTDRTTLALPPAMTRLAEAVTAANPRTVLVVMSSYPYVIPGAAAILWTCHAGQETGHALADLLTGRHAPEGRLPQTWYAGDGDLPDALDYDIITAGWTYQYSRAQPRYPFGHGLTYTSFGYGRLRLTDRAATVAVTNTGARDGTEVVQLYADYRQPGRPRRRLLGFARVTLAPGETRDVEIPLPASALALWDTSAGELAVPPGEIEIAAGASCADIRQAATRVVLGSAPARAAARIAAADFDDQENITLTDVTRVDGDAVTPADTARRSWLLFRSVYTERAVVARFRVSCAVPDGGRIEVWRADKLLAEAAVPGTCDRYIWTEVTAPLAPADGTGEVRLVLHGPVRLHWFWLG
jgi:beta-glucosidase